MVTQSCCSTNIACFFSCLCHVKGDSALTLSLVEHDIRLIDGDHGVINLLERLLVDLLMIATIVHDLALFVHYSETFYFFYLTLETHVGREFVLEKKLTIDFTHGSKRSER